MERSRAGTAAEGAAAGGEKKKEAVQTAKPERIQTEEMSEEPQEEEAQAMSMTL